MRADSRCAFRESKRAGATKMSTRSTASLMRASSPRRTTIRALELRSALLWASPSRSMLFLGLAMRLELATVPDVAMSPAKLKESKLASTQETRSHLAQSLPLDEVLLSIQVLKSLPPMAQLLRL